MGGEGRKDWGDGRGCRRHTVNNLRCAARGLQDKRENLTVLASDDNGEHFTRSLQIVPPGHMSGGFPTPGTGYSQLQCGLPEPLDCAVAFDDGQEFNYAFPYCNISWVRFSSADVK